MFQRTPNFSVPARSGPLDPELERSIKAEYAAYRQGRVESRAGLSYPLPTRSVLSESEEDREREFEARWAKEGRGCFACTTTSAELGGQRDRRQLRTAEDRRDRSLSNAVAELLSPDDHPIGTKRVSVDTDYYATYNRDNVTLVDIRSAPIQEITPQGIRTTDVDYNLDPIVFATGFDAMTGPILGVDFAGRGGIQLKEKWHAGPRTYLGLMTAGFPNLFMITAPGSPSVLSNMMVSIEQHVEWITEYIRHLREAGLATTEPALEYEDSWVEHVNDVASRTLYHKANLWYLGVNIPGKVRVFMPYVGGVGPYRERCDAIAAYGYEGFVHTA